MAEATEVVAFGQIVHEFCHGNSPVDPDAKPVCALQAFAETDQCNLVIPIFTDTGGQVGSILADCPVKTWNKTKERRVIGQDQSFIKGKYLMRRDVWLIDKMVEQGLKENKFRSEEECAMAMRYWLSSKGYADLSQSADHDITEPAVDDDSHHVAGVDQSECARLQYDILRERDA